MPVISIDAAIERLTRIVEDKFGPDELLEVYNELFDADHFSPEVAHANPTQISEQLVDHINASLDPEDLLRVWNLICPHDRQVWYDEDKQMFHYNEVEKQVAE
jgi:hypothetical protein